MQKVYYKWNIELSTPTNTETDLISEAPIHFGQSMSFR